LDFDQTQVIEKEQVDHILFKPINKPELLHVINKQFAVS